MRESYKILIKKRSKKRIERVNNRNTSEKKKANVDKRENYKNLWKEERKQCWEREGKLQFFFFSFYNDFALYKAREVTEAEFMQICGDDNG